MNLAHFEQLSSYLPIDLLTWSGFFIALAVLSLFIIARYFGFVFLFYMIFWQKKWPSFKYLHDQKLKPSQIYFEIKWSLISSLIFALSGYALGVVWQSDLTLIYLKLDQYGLWYLPVSFVLVSLIHEIYFYLTHRLMHWRSVYTRIHATHHFSMKPSPWASFSFHPGEAVVHAVFLPLMVFLLPMHPLVILSYLTFMTLTAISNHLGVEILGSPWLRRWFISGEHHGLHHHHYNYNFGLYFCFMDRLFKTEHQTVAGGKK